MAARSFSDTLLLRLVVLCLLLRLARRRLDSVTMDDRSDEESDEELDPSVFLAQRDMAVSTTAAIAVNLPPKRDELVEEEEDAMDTAGLGERGGGCPLKISPSSWSLEPVGRLSCVN